MYFAVTFQATFLAVIARCAAEHKSVDTLITNGQDARPHSAPWIVSIQSADEEHMCGGSIINASWVVTAAHCTFENFPYIVAGLYDLDDDDSPTEQRRIIDYTRVYRHPKYPSEPRLSANDIALIRVDPPFVFNADVQPIALPPANRIPSGVARIFGWGSTSTTDEPDILQTAELVIWSYERCLAAAPHVMKPTMLCAGPLTDGVAVCFGDSGGPLCQDEQLVGIITWSFRPCGKGGKPSGFTRTSAFVEWIAAVQRDNP